MTLNTKLKYLLKKDLVRLINTAGNTGFASSEFTYKMKFRAPLSTRMKSPLTKAFGAQRFRSANSCPMLKLKSKLQTNKN
jgi:hypothetical protein